MIPPCNLLSAPNWYKNVELEEGFSTEVPSLKIDRPIFSDLENASCRIRYNLRTTSYLARPPTQEKRLALTKADHHKKLAPRTVEQITPADQITQAQHRVKCTVPPDFATYTRRSS
ncbi:hypothetical protein F511_22108 [Dorcoceras hygrometricum]|uniref:Uncharacterized protein n=1 Tax=Dorcoceras hygrometricum TaxID=472368 RepID=A0A2Z7B755_9LAMI|nr:hypothetical protein F511_22108 [Dorcoceras hygrometricum]